MSSLVNMSFEEELRQANVPFNIHEALRVLNVFMGLISIRTYCHRMLRICDDDDIEALEVFVREYKECTNSFMPDFNLTYNEGVIVHFALKVVLARCYSTTEYLYMNWKWNSSDDDSDPETYVQNAVASGTLRI